MECKNVWLIYPNKKSEDQIMLLLRAQFLNKTGYCKITTSKIQPELLLVCKLPAFSTTQHRNCSKTSTCTDPYLTPQACLLRAQGQKVKPFLTGGCAPTSPEHLTCCFVEVSPVGSTYKFISSINRETHSNLTKALQEGMVIACIKIQSSICVASEPVH